MPRTVVYPPSTPRHFGDPNDNTSDSDRYSEKIVKFVPAEVLAFYLPAVSLSGDDVNLIRLCFGAGLIGTLVYLLTAGQSEAKEKKPLPHFYILAVIAFAVWAVGVSQATGSIFGVDPRTATVILTITVFLLPGVDTLLAKWLRRTK